MKCDLYPNGINNSKITKDEIPEIFRSRSRRWIFSGSSKSLNLSRNLPFPRPPHPTPSSGYGRWSRSNCCQLLFAVYFAPFCCSSTVAFIIHRSSYCGGRYSMQLQQNGPEQAALARDVTALHRRLHS